MKKCVIIGSGLGGLSCGCILAKNGYEVTVLEKNPQFGGCLQCFRRGDAVFDTGMHYIGSLDPGQVLNIYFRYLGIDKDIKLSKLDPLGYDVISYKGKYYQLANGRDAFINTLSNHFPSCRGELIQYYDLIKKISSSWVLHSLNRNVDFNVNTEYQMQSVNNVIDSIISDPILRQVIVGILPLYAGVKDHTPFSTHALISDCYEKSAYRIVGGSSLVADSLVNSIRNMGGKVLSKQKVTNIECNDVKATSVITESGECFPTDIIISAIHPALTLQLIDSHLIRPTYRRRIMNIQNTTSVFTVYLKFRKNSVRYMNKNLYIYRGDSIWGCENYNDLTWPKCLLYMHFCHEENPTFARSGEILTYMNISEVQQWIGTHVGQRGSSYEDFKKMKAEVVIQALEQEIPGVSQNIEEYYTSTPLTYLDYTGIPDGAMYGMFKDVQNIVSSSVTSRTKIPNLFLAGQSITLHGMLGVLAGSLSTCSELLTIDEMFSQLKDI